ncbi:hypothetical protein Pmani_040241 [Petrolisthes manimaculis]|uniref:Uncharacterized protein n=1 Tax=Petrolisthes manimaculis TaxID=1843537 RepID=A0AAE1TIL7_9EUCA|nr:hypothetical protein Pmani_040241 [Petrolisthes manimaculis]
MDERVWVRDGLGRVELEGKNAKEEQWNGGEKCNGGTVEWRGEGEERRGRGWRGTYCHAPSFLYLLTIPTAPTSLDVLEPAAGHSLRVSRHTTNSNIL